jgi:hypothetical protein
MTFSLVNAFTDVHFELFSTQMFATSCLDQNTVALPSYISFGETGSGYEVSGETLSTLGYGRGMIHDSVVHEVRVHLVL